MKRRLLKLGVFLLLGAIVNVAVAWGCCTRAQLKYRGPGPVPVQLTNEFSQWLDRKPQGFTVSRTALIDGSYLGTETYGLSDGGTFARDQSQVDTRIGWLVVAGVPVRSLAGCRWIHQTRRGSTLANQTLVINSQYLDGTFTYGDLLRPTLIPFRPLWPGFAINTIFYTAILALLFFGPSKLRRFIRIRKGQCPICGFIIAPGTCANGVCTECGTALPRWKSDAPLVSRAMPNSKS